MPTPATTSERTYRLLCLDGGGTWSLIQIRALQRLFKNDNISGHEVLKHFDLVAANSGGSVAAMAMAAGWPLSRIADFYLSDALRRQVFVKLSFFEKGLGQWILKALSGVGPKYKTSAKLQGLKTVFPNVGDVLLSEIPAIIGAGSPHFLIPAFDYDRERATFFRSDKGSRSQSHLIAHDRGLKSDGAYKDVTVAQAMHASTNAPLNFFNKPAIFYYESKNPQKRYWDGAVGGYNNPVMAGLTEALSNGVRLEDIRILSIGTGSDFRPLKNTNASATESAYPILYQEAEKQTLGNDIEKLARSILSDPPDAATFTAYTLLHSQQLANPPRLVRMNPLVQPVRKFNRWELPEGLAEAEFKALVELEMDAVKQEEIELVDRFCHLWLEDKVPNQPVRTDSELAPVLGHGRFSEAMEAAALLL